MSELRPGHRRSIRLPHHDYAEPGAYFITVCVQDRACLLGKIEDVQMFCNAAGVMVQKWWDCLPQRFPSVKCDVSMVMPNHFHGIIILGDVDVAPENGPNRPDNRSAIGDIMDWFKTMTTNEYIRNVKNCGWSPFAGRLWQRNYFEHVIRGDGEFLAIAEYIVGNPAQWPQDKDNPVHEQRSGLREAGEPWRV